MKVTVWNVWDKSGTWDSKFFTEMEAVKRAKDIKGQVQEVEAFRKFYVKDKMGGLNLICDLEEEAASRSRLIGGTVECERIHGEEDGIALG
jgi:hypothetical protein